MSIDDEIKKEIVKFAEDNPEILSVYKVDVSEPQPTYYFFKGEGPFDFDFAEKLAEFSGDAHDKLGILILANHLTDSPENHSFKDCVYKKLTIEDKVHEKLIEFAKKNPKVLAIYKGNDPEEDSVIYYFIKESKKHEREFSDSLSHLSLRLMRELDEHVRVMCWPTTVKGAKEYGFIGECIYEK